MRRAECIATSLHPSYMWRRSAGKKEAPAEEPCLATQVDALQKENRELGERSAASSGEASERARELAELAAKLAAAEKAAEKLRQAAKKVERERDSRPLPEALVRCSIHAWPYTGMQD